MSAANTGMRALLERRTELKTQLQTIHDKHADGALPEPAQKQWDGLKADLDALENRIARQSLLDDTERRIAGQQIGGGQDNRWTELLNGYSLARACLHGDPHTDAGLEREASQETERRTGRTARAGCIRVPDEVFMARAPETRAGQTAQDFTAGGALVPDRFRPDLMIDRLRAASILPRVGVVTLDGLTGATVIPKLTDSGTVQWVGENEEPTESEAGFGNIALTPRTASCSMSYSRRTLINAVPAIDGLLRDDMARQMAAALDAAAISGAGGKQPIGLLNMPALPTVTLTNDTLTPEQLIDLAAGPDISDAMGPGPAWVTNGRVIAAAQKLKDGAGLYMFLNTLPNTLLGYGTVRSSAVPSNLGASSNFSALVFGVWSSMIVGRWSGIDLLSDPYTRGSSGAVRLYAFMDIDVGVRHIEAFNVATNVATA